MRQGRLLVSVPGELEAGADSLPAWRTVHLGRMLVQSSSNPKSEAVQRERYSRTIFVGRLSVRDPETTDEDLNNYQQFGEIAVGSVMRTNNSRDGKSRGFGLVEFRNKGSAEAAIASGHPAWHVQERKYQPSVGTFLAAHDRTQRVSITPEVICLKPHDIRFSHDRISFCFKDRKLVDETIEKCLSGASSFEDAPFLQVVQNPSDGLYYSLSNRRLFVARVLSSRGVRFAKDGQIAVKLFPFKDRHVQAQWRKSFRSDCQGRFVVPAGQCGACKRDHMSRFMNEHVAAPWLDALRTALSARCRARAKRPDLESEARQATPELELSSSKESFKRL